MASLPASPLAPRTLVRTACALAFLGAIVLSLGCNSFNRVELGPLAPASDELAFRRVYTDTETRACIGPAQAAGRILLLPIHGVIAAGERAGRGTSPSTIHRMLRMASRDKSIRAILLKIDSPGGTVTDSDVILAMIREFAEKRKLPVYAHVDDLAASGGYYVAMAATHINVVPTGRVGSIGVILRSFSATGLLDKVGLRDRSIVSGRNKDTLSPFRELRDDERHFLQQQVDEMYARFFGIVLKSRAPRVTEEKLRELADGRVLTAAQAAREKLVDSTESLDEFLKRIKKERGLSSIEVVGFLPEGRRYRNLHDVRTERGGTGAEILRRLTGVDLPAALYLWTGGI